VRVDYAGREITVKAIRPLIDFLSGYPATASGLGRVDTSGERISWDDLCTLLEAAAALTDDLARIGADGLSSALYQYRRRVRLARRLLTIDDALRFILYPRNPIDFSCMSAAMRHETGRVDVVAHINSGHQFNATFFEIIRGAAEEIARQFRLPQATVSLNISGRQAHYVFAYEPRTGFAARIRRWVSRAAFSLYSILVIRSAYPYLVQGRKMFEQQLVERARLEEELIQNEQAFDRRLENIDDVIAEFDPQGTLVYVSPNIERLVGVTVEAAVANPNRLVHPEDFTTLQADLVQVLADPVNGRVEDFRVLDAAGAVRWVELDIGPFQTSTGERHVLGVARDVTQRRRYRERQRRLDRQLERSRRLEMLGVLAGGIAHDFNNLLVPLLGETDLVKSDLEDRPELQERLEIVEGAGQRAADLVRQLMVYSGTEEGSFTTLDLAETTRQLLELIEMSVPEGVELRLHLGEAAPVRGDVSQLRQVILNLVINAAEAIGEAEGAIDLAVRREGGKVALTVLDDGCGMDEATRECAFEPFFSTKFAGRGLGLSAVIGAVRAHNGDLTVDTEQGRGTLITVTLDADQRTVPGAGQRAVRERNTPGTVLLVDDEEAIRHVGQAMLEAANYQVEVACDGEEALAKFEAGNYRSIVLDLVMPKVDGREVLSAVRRSQPQLPVVIVSGYGAQLVSAKVTADPFTRFLSKPFRAEDLVGALRELAAAVPES